MGGAGNQDGNYKFSTCPTSLWTSHLDKYIAKAAIHLTSPAMVALLTKQSAKPIGIVDNNIWGGEVGQGDNLLDSTF